MPKDSYLPTEEDLQKIKDLDNGWEEVWDKICTELLGYDSKGRIHQAAKRYLRSHTSDYSECNCEDFASHIFIIFQEKVHNKKLFIAYDSDKSNGNVYGFL
ncbi:MAG: hypothetical protein LBQ66_05755, partial [Planctomycetaceae bacterium]|nr:hypothetical protein [Planctomycetaceae bacterium]